MVDWYAHGAACGSQILPCLLIQVQLSMPSATGQTAAHTFKVYCQVTRGVRGGAGLTVHSGIRLHNSCGVLLSVGMQQRWPCNGGTDEESFRTTKLVAVGESVWLPALCCSATYLAVQPAGTVLIPKLLLLAHCI